MAEVTVPNDFGAQEKKIYHCFHFFPICHEVMGSDATIFMFLMLSFKPAFSLPSCSEGIIILTGGRVPAWGPVCGQWWGQTWAHAHPPPELTLHTLCCTRAAAPLLLISGKTGRYHRCTRGSLGHSRYKRQPFGLGLLEVVSTKLTHAEMSTWQVYPPRPIHQL